MRARPAWRFAHRLALALGEVDVRRMLAGLPAQQFRDWIDFDAIEPIGELRADLRMAVLASTMVNLQRRRGRRATVADFLPEFDAAARQARRATTLPAMRAIMNALTAAQNAQVDHGDTG